MLRAAATCIAEYVTSQLGSSRTNQGYGPAAKVSASRKSLLEFAKKLPGQAFNIRTDFDKKTIELQDAEEACESNISQLPAY